MTTVLASIKETCTYQEPNSIFYVCASSKQPPVYLHKVFRVLHFAWKEPLTMSFIPNESEFFYLLRISCKYPMYFYLIHPQIYAF